VVKCEANRISKYDLQKCPKVENFVLWSVGEQAHASWIQYLTVNNFGRVSPE
jgi:hypothetical protein